jgi:hypothetical protein
VNDWGIPDWRDPSAYGETTSWSKSRWRWEFTRRRKDYRDDFEKNVKPTLDQLNERIRLDPKQRFLGCDDPGFVAVLCVGDSRSLVEKYGLIHLPNPRISDQPFWVLTFKRRFGGVMCGEGPFRWHPNLPAEEETAAMMVPKGAAALQIDLSAPIGPQLKNAKEILVILQEKQEGKVVRHNRHPKKWFTYLRVLDAKEDGAKLTEIAQSGVLGKLVRSNDAPRTAPRLRIKF